MTTNNKLIQDVRVKVTYPDNTFRETTVSELMDFFKDESKDWKKWFFNTLGALNTASTSFAQYTVIAD